MVPCHLHQAALVSDGLNFITCDIQGQAVILESAALEIGVLASAAREVAGSLFGEELVDHEEVAEQSAALRAFRCKVSSLNCFCCSGG